MYVDIDNFEPQQCLMYWENPAYIPLKTRHKYSYKYSLYLHRENSYDTQLKGIPLLFIHGNGGRYKQVSF